jgi:hypothetical protein
MFAATEASERAQWRDMQRRATISYVHCGHDRAKKFSKLNLSAIQNPTRAKLRPFHRHNFRSMSLSFMMRR